MATMKKSYMLLLCSLLTVHCSLNAQPYGWTDLSANIPGSPNLSGVFFVSDDEGWITSSSHAEIYHTTDGGKTFEVKTNLYTCNAIHMLNENVGYAGGASGFIYKTTDGGANWNFFGTMVANLAEISFPPNGDTGYACGINGNIYSISNSGVTKMNSGVPDTQTGISFPVHSSEGWVCGGSIIRHYIHETWTAADQDYPSGGYNAIYMVDSLNGWIVGDEGIIAHTADGKNWFEQTNPDPENQTLYDVYFLNKNEGWAVGIGGQILHTTNGGDNWDISIEGTYQLNAIHFTSPTNGYVVGNGKTLLKYGELSGIGDEQGGMGAWGHGGMVVWPNPTQGKFQIPNSKFQTNSKFKIQNSTLQVEVVDLFGKPVAISPLHRMGEGPGVGAGTLELDISDYPAGMYFVRIKTGNELIVTKIVKL